MPITKRFAKLAAAGAALAFAFATFSAPASARDSYVNDGAELFSASTVSALNSKISAFEARTHKEVVVVTESSLNGAALNDHVESVFAQQQVNGVLFYFAKAEKKDLVVGDKASRKFFPNGFNDIALAMRPGLRSGDFDGAVTTGVNLVLDTYSGHESSLPGNGGSVQTRTYAPVTQHQSLGGGMFSLLFAALALIVLFLIVRAIFRAIAGPRRYPPGYGGGPGFGGGPGYGGPGYGGGGYGYGGGGGGGFFSGLLGGLGGAFIGNELFGNRGNETIIEQQPGTTAGFVDGGNNSGGDGGGWQSDAGQADMGGAGGGGWGGGDGGGGGWGGGDGGGGGDSGGGW